MANFISISDINTISDPVYVLVAGGIAVGKSTVVERELTIPIMDIDTVMAEMGFSKYNKKNYSAAMKTITEQVEDMLDRKQSMVAMGTASNLQFSIDRLFGAKQLGYTTALLYIDAPISQAIDQNDKRKQQKQRAISSEQEYKIRRTNVGAANTVAALKDTTLVDYFVHYMNHES